MRAYGASQFGRAGDVLQVIEIDRPVPGPRDLLVRIVAVATNPVDVKALGNFFGAPELAAPLIPGWDASGVVEAVGADASLFQPGDEIFFSGTSPISLCSVSRSGSFAEYALVDERLAGRKPTTLSHEEAAALPLTSITAWELMVEIFGLAVPADVGQSDVNESKTLLVLGGAGGVGSIAIQMAKQVLKIGRVVATASRPESAAFAREMGADSVIDHTKPMVEQLAELGLGQGVDLIFVTSEPDGYADQLGQLIKPLGKIGFILPAVVTITLFLKRVSLLCENMMARSMYGVELEKQGEILNRVSSLVDERTLRTTAHTRFAWSELPQAIALQESGRAIGKIVLTVAF